VFASLLALWAAAVVVVICMILGGQFHPVRDDGVQIERMPWVWGWYAVQIAAALLWCLTTFRLRAIKAVK
jgi:hypothetical protein